MIQYGGKKKSIVFGGRFGKQAKPSEIEYSSERPDIEKDSKEELDAATQAFSNKARAEQQKFKDNVDANYFTVVTFNNSAQLQEFLRKVGIKANDPQYIAGKDLAMAMGITIETPDKDAPGAFKASKALKDLV